ncbi:MAG: hypothetical protein Fur0018_04810 [Anaerolineales bacterium]
MPPLRASEIGTYLYCQRAWWYQRKGVVARNQGELAAGTQLHYLHGENLLRARLLRLCGYLLLLAALILMAVSFASQWAS